ncbi:MAG: hypothetical protein ABIH72_02590 [archaeon]
MGENLEEELTKLGEVEDEVSQPIMFFGRDQVPEDYENVLTKGISVTSIRNKVDLVPARTPPAGQMFHYIHGNIIDRAFGTQKFYIKAEAEHLAKLKEKLEKKALEEARERNHSALKISDSVDFQAQFSNFSFSCYSANVVYNAQATVKFYNKIRGQNER